MIAIIIGLIIALIAIVIVVNMMQQHKEKQEAEKRVLIAKQKAIIDETEEIILNLSHLPQNPDVMVILNRRSFNAAKAMQKLSPDTKNLAKKVSELDARLKASSDLATNHVMTDESFVLPDNEQQLIAVLQCIKKLRAIIKSEQSKGVLDAQAFMKQDQRLDAMQLKINIESLLKRGMQAYNKDMLGSARQYFEKALQSLSSHPIKSEYITTKKAEITEKLGEITTALKSTNAQDAAKKAKDEEDDLDLLFQPKKKW